MTHYINGEWVDAGGTVFTSINPSNGNELWSGKSAETMQVEAAVKAARDAFESWSTTPFEKRVEHLTAFRDLVESKKDELADIISKETGKVPWDAAGEAAAAIGKLKFSLAAYEERCADKSTDMGGFRAALRHRPHGVMAVYGPYNFPAHLPNGHIVPALLAGNTVVFKPSELTPAVGEWMVKQWEASGLPKGVINLVQGEKDTGIALSNAQIDGLLFTGSSETGKILHKLFAGRPEIMLALELGGNNPLIIGPISDIKAAVHETILSAYISSGQRCTCARRLIVVEGDHTQPFIDLLAETVSKLNVSTPEDTNDAFMGPIVSSIEAGTLLEAQNTLEKNGANVLVRMESLHDSLPFLSPALIDVTNAGEREDREWFGPMLQIIRVPDFDAAIKEANNTQYGLSAGLLCDDASLYEQFLLHSRAGIINWNKQTTGASGMAPFGGIGCSGNHHPAGYYAADYCAYPVASMEADALALPDKLPAGMRL